MTRSVIFHILLTLCLCMVILSSLLWKKIETNKWPAICRNLISELFDVTSTFAVHWLWQFVHPFVKPVACVFVVFSC